MIPPGYVEFDDFSYPGQYVVYTPHCNFCNWRLKAVRSHIVDTEPARLSAIDAIWNHAKQFHKIQIRKEYGL